MTPRLPSPHRKRPMTAAPVALLYDDSAYVEAQGQPRPGAGEAPVGLVGRQVAGREFLDAYLTHGAARVLTDLVTAPSEPYDALICTSAAVVRMVRAVTGAYADYLRDRFGGAPALRPRLETIPLGVNPERFRPATPQERAARRAAL